jgi:predicted Zn-dependent protease
MKPLPIAEQYHIEATKGWILLGNQGDAHQELDEISHAWKEHPEVLELRWYLFAEEEKWDAALRIAQKLHKKHPKRLFGWLAHAHSILKCTGNPEAARKLLCPAAEMFDGPQIAYGLACYSSLAGKFAEGREWLARALAKSHTDEVDEFCTVNPELEALTEFLQKIQT